MPGDMQLGHGGGLKTMEYALTYHCTADIDIRVRVRGGGHVSQVFAIRQAIAKSVVSPLTSTIMRLV